MIPKKYIIPLILAAVGVGWGQAAEPNPLSVVPAGEGSVRQFPIDKIDKITFDGANMIVTTADGSEALPVSQIEKLCFDLEYDGVGEVAADLADGLHTAISGGILSVTAGPGTAIHIAVYDTAGMLRHAVNATATASVDFNTMPSGIYIIKVNDKTIKYMNR